MANIVSFLYSFFYIFTSLSIDGLFYIIYSSIGTWISHQLYLLKKMIKKRLAIQWRIHYAGKSNMTQRNMTLRDTRFSI